MKSNNNTYINRLVEKNIKESLNTIGAINLVGPKYCGKTSTAEFFSKSKIYIQDDYKTNIIMFENNKDYILKGRKPRLIDEWQLIPSIWDAIRFEVDKTKTTANFILTGSVNIDNSSINHSGAGRILRLQMYPMSLTESNESNKSVSLTKLFNKQKITPAVTKKNIKQIAYYMCRGGWPFLIQNKGKKYSIILKSYLDAITNIDFESDDKIKIKPNILKVILNSLARNNTTQIKVSKILNDIKNLISRNTLLNYLNYLKNIFVYEELNIWINNNFRSKTKILTTPKFYFCDPSLGLYLLGVKESNFIKDLNTFGFYFENLVIRDLKIYATYLDGEIYFYRDENDFEIDAIMQLSNNKLAAFEIKLSEFEVDKAANNLLKFANKFETKYKPIFLAVITATNFFYQRKDGVYVIPIHYLTV